VVDATLAMMNQTSHQAMLALAGIQATTDYREELSRLDAPVLFLHGDQDASAPIELTSKPGCALVKGSRLIVYDGGPHGLYFTHKARLNADTIRFTTSLGAET
jgi:non-heme chloroperoxidase